MMRTIANRLTTTSWHYFNSYIKKTVFVVNVQLDGEFFLRREVEEDDERGYVSYIDVEEQVVRGILEEWPCDQTSSSELPLRKTITSSYGQLKVTLSL